MVYHIGLAEIKSQHKASMKWQLNDAKDVNCCCELEGPIIRHDGIIKQALTDGSIVVICHFSQHTTVCNNKKKKEVELSHTFRIGDNIFLCHKVHQYFGQSLLVNMGNCFAAEIMNSSKDLCIFKGIYSQTMGSLVFLDGEGNGNPLQYSCLENPRFGRAWWAAVCGVAQSQTRLRRLSSSSSSSLP